MKKTILPCGNAPVALKFEHFPNRLACFLFRNHGLVPTAVLAGVLGTTEQKVAAACRRMALPEYSAVDPEEFRRRGYITLIRQNWHLLDYPQLLQLLGIDAEELAFRLKEDDFLFHKLGSCKPVCGELRWTDFSPEECCRLDGIGEEIRRFFAGVALSDFRPFQFGKRASLAQKAKCEAIRMSYPYAVGCGDFLAADDLEDFPESFFADYAAGGLNAVWIQATLYRLIPWDRAPEMSQGWEKRLGNLRRISERAAKYGIGIYVYFNEPRTIVPAYADRFAELKGLDLPDGGISLCTAHDAVRNYLQESMEKLFTSCPLLAGILTITRSENFTNCASSTLNKLESCPVCSHNGAPATIAGVLNAYAAGMHAVKPEARLLAYVWGWEKSWLEEIAGLMEYPNTSFLSVSEYGVETDCEGVKSEVIDYSIAHPGPGDYAKEAWRAAADHQLGRVAKIQLNNSWEMSAMPYLPLFDLIGQHISAIRDAGVEEFMLCWTHGGGPSPLTGLLYYSKDELLPLLYGDDAAAISRASVEFSDAFREFPFDFTTVIYNSPVNCGPVNLLWRKPTNYLATMVGFPYDDLKRWRGKFPPDVFSRAFGRIVAGWKRGLALLSEVKTANGIELKHYAEAAGCHFQSTFDQIEFIRRRDSGVPTDDILEREIITAVRTARLQIADPAIGFEASNAYFYTPNLLMEKALNANHCTGKIMSEIL